MGRGWDWGWDRGWGWGWNRKNLGFRGGRCEATPLHAVGAWRKPTSQPMGQPANQYLLSPGPVGGRLAAAVSFQNKWPGPRAAGHLSWTCHLVYPGPVGGSLATPVGFQNKWPGPRTAGHLSWTCYLFSPGSVGRRLALPVGL